MINERNTNFGTDTALADFGLQTNDQAIKKEKVIKFGTNGFSITQVFIPLFRQSPLPFCLSNSNIKML
ncbi:hypothetical protein [Capnocytophaga canimorsus]|uniref:hypothetical protein n=1 Tax=Capnocytophaga canimorsus TaxID=28188 RepID=UPI00385AE666